MKKVIDTAFDRNLQLIEETLTDGSKVYNVIIGYYELPCRTLRIANELFDNILTDIHEAQQA